MLSAHAVIEYNLEQRLCGWMRNCLGSKLFESTGAATNGGRTGSGSYGSHATAYVFTDTSRAPLLTWTPKVVRGVSGRSVGRRIVRTGIQVAKVVGYADPRRHARPRLHPRPQPQ